MTAGITPEKLDIEFLYVDLDVCARCRGTDSALDEAVAELAPVLAATGVQVRVKKIQVRSEAQARELGFVISPTIRVNERDIQPDIKGSLCEACGALCGECVDCRVWTFKGKEYPVPPKGMIMEAVLRAAYGPTAEPSGPAVRRQEVPENLRRFFAGKRGNKASSCA